MKKGKVFVNDIHAGFILQDDDGHIFYYLDEYLANPKATPVSLTLPLSKIEYKSKTLFPFFDGLIPEGYLLNIALNVYELDYKYRMDLLLKVCKDVIGNVSIEEIKDDE
jgi:serine/threonine-protein kinase HipA